MGLRYFLEDIEDEESIFIYGAGNFGKHILNKMNKERVEGFIDEKVTGKVMGIETYTLNSIVRKNDYTYVVAVVNPEEKRVITRRLINYGISDSKIIIPLPSNKKEFFDRDIFFYEDYWIPYLNRKLKENNRLNEFLNSNNIRSIALVGDVNANRIISESIENAEISIENYDATDLAHLITEEIVLISFPYNFLYFYDIIARLTSSPIIDIMRML